MYTKRNLETWVNTHLPNLREDIFSEVIDKLTELGCSSIIDRLKYVSKADIVTPLKTIDASLLCSSSENITSYSNPSVFGN